jgi:hypothetical protein
MQTWKDFLGYWIRNEPRLFFLLTLAYLIIGGLVALACLT